MPSNGWGRIAGDVDALLRQPSARERFQEQTRQAAQERVAAVDHLARREAARRAFTAEHGAWYGADELPERPGRDFQHHLEVFRGSAKLPKGRKRLPKSSHNAPAKEAARALALWRGKMRPFFETAREQGFPAAIDDVLQDNGVGLAAGFFPFEFQVEVWLPERMGPENDPPIDDPLPVPRRPVTLPEKFAALAAICDAHWRGAVKIAPWGATDDGGLRVRPYAGGRIQYATSLWYRDLVEAAGTLDESDLPIVSSWLQDVAECLAGDGDHPDGGDQDATKSRRKRGRRPLAPTAAEERLQILEDWNRAKEAGVSKKEFCKQRGIKTRHLKNIQDWERHRRDASGD